MGYNKSVDSSALNTNLTSIANAIRNKTGSSGQLSFPTGMINEINNIPVSSGDTGEVTSTVASNTYKAPLSVINANKIKMLTLYYNGQWTTVTPSGTYFTNGEIIIGTALPKFIIVDATHIQIQTGARPVSYYDGGIIAIADH